MPETDWTFVRRLLVAYDGPADGLPAVGPVLRALCEALPGRALTFWLPSSSGVDGALYGAESALAPNCVSVLFAPANWPEPSSLRPAINELQQRHFDAAVILTPPGLSPYAVGYACYLAGIPIRLGQSVEFGGVVLSHRVRPRPAPAGPLDHHLHLLEVAGLAPYSQKPGSLLSPVSKENA